MLLKRSIRILIFLTLLFLGILLSATFLYFPSIGPQSEVSIEIKGIHIESRFTIREPYSRTFPPNATSIEELKLNYAHFENKTVIVRGIASFKTSDPNLGKDTWTLVDETGTIDILVHAMDPLVEGELIAVGGILRVVYR